MAFDFERLEVYKKSVDFANKVYNITKEFPRSERFGIVNQIRRAAVSISLNIAEGSGRSKKEFKHYLLLSRTSVQECIPILRISVLQGYIKEKEMVDLYNNCEELSKMLCGLFNSI